IMWVAITIHIDARTISHHHMMALGTAVALSGALVYSTYALLFSLHLSIERYRSHYAFAAIALSGILMFVGANFLLAGSLDLIKTTSANQLASINQSQLQST
ncbi:MAG: hypothetical protein KTR35_24435, partial [Gammaproteobacteria bacterium]|nr:hypothetical protein [Gammaproteobacteria bacterium]